METKVQTTDKSERRDSSLPLSDLVAPIGVSSFALVIVLKIILMAAFTSGYMSELFVPFVRHFVETFDNPWDYFYQTTSQRDQFPYPPLMLYLEAFCSLPLKVFGWDNLFLTNFFMKLPILLSDILIARLLIAMFPTRVNKVFWFYFLSPIILYACYMHSQLDLIPTAILFSAAFLLRKQSSARAAFLMGLALATKTHVAAAIPLFLVYIYRNQKPVSTALFTTIAALTMMFFLYPYLDSPGFQALVLHNPKQSQIFESHVDIGSMQIFLPIFAVFMAYGRFALYPKINTDLLDAFLTIVFALFVLTIVPAPGWYVWITPFLAVFMCKYSDRDHRIVPACFALYSAYLFYFLFFHRFDYPDLIAFNVPLNFKITADHAPSVAFTLLEVTLLANIVLLYRIGVRSNFNYKRDKAVVIGIGGDSGAGKSTLLHDIKKLLHTRVVELEGDADHKWERDDENWKGYTHLDPKANFLHRQADTIFNLKRGKSVQRVDYDHDTGSFTSARVIKPNDFIVLSGLHTFYLPKSRKVIDLKIYMDPEHTLKAYWKISRDQRERGYSPQQVMDQMNRRKTDRDKFIAPQRDFADLCVRYKPVDRTTGGDLTAEPKLTLELSLSSSIQLEDLVQELMRTGLLAHWDYNEDLSRQDLSLLEPMPIEMLQKTANNMIPNLDELVSQTIEWEEGFRGFVQLIILLLINDLMKEQEQTHE
ncbi:hypothetical protein BH10CYA1_BH10CYA1_20100 [soil metagenome]